MGYIAEGSFSEGWNLISGEPLPSDLADMQGIDAEPAQYKRGSLSGPRYAQGDLPSERMSIACREGRHWAPERPEGSCHGERLNDNYEWQPCECPVCHGQEVE